MMGAFDAELAVLGLGYRTPCRSQDKEAVERADDRYFVNFLAEGANVYGPDTFEIYEYKDVAFKRFEEIAAEHRFPQMEGPGVDLEILRNTESIAEFRARYPTGKV